MHLKDNGFSIKYGEGYCTTRQHPMMFFEMRLFSATAKTVMFYLKHLRWQVLYPYGLHHHLTLRGIFPFTVKGSWHLTVMPNV